MVITGASAGVGRATAREFAKAGAKVALIARGRDGLEGARRDVEQLGGQALPIECDVADPNGLESAADRIERELGPIDLWVNDAMVSVYGPFVDTAPSSGSTKTGAGSRWRLRAWRWQSSARWRDGGPAASAAIAGTFAMLSRTTSGRSRGLGFCGN